MPKAIALVDLTQMPNVVPSSFELAEPERLRSAMPTHKPRILLLYGSVRERSYSRLLTQEAARLLEALGTETRIFDPSGLPLPDDARIDHPKVQELRELSSWSEGQVWCSPERHGAMTGIMKAQIDWIPLSIGAVRPTQGKTLALMQVSGGSQSFNASIRRLYPWLRHVFADGGYAGDKLRGALAAFGKWTLEIIKRSDRAKGFEVLPRRWVIERTFAWLGRCRRLAKDFETTIASATAWVLVAHIRTVTRRLARP